LPLLKFFRTQKKATFTLKIKDIEEIFGQPLCHSAHHYPSYWTRKGYYNISVCWLSNGYRIRKIDFNKGAVIFEKYEELGETINIPTVFLGRVSPTVKAAAETALEYVAHRYGLSPKKPAKKTKRKPRAPAADETDAGDVAATPPPVTAAKKAI